MKGFIFRNNTFYLSKYALFTLKDDLAGDGQQVNAQPVFTGNTYVQSASSPLLQKNDSTEIYYPAEGIVRDILGDENGKFVMIGEKDRSK